MRTQVTNSHGACIMSFHSGLVPTITMYITKNSLGTIPALSDGGMLRLELTLGHRVTRRRKIRKLLWQNHSKECRLAVMRTFLLGCRYFVGHTPGGQIHVKISVASGGRLSGHERCQEASERARGVTSNAFSSRSPAAARLRFTIELLFTDRLVGYCSSQHHDEFRAKNHHTMWQCKSSALQMLLTHNVMHIQSLPCLHLERSSWRVLISGGSRPINLHSCQPRHLKHDLLFQKSEALRMLQIPLVSRLSVLQKIVVSARRGLINLIWVVQDLLEPEDRRTSEYLRQIVR